jgi:hypothetical protein
MSGSIRCKEEWRIRNNNELQKLILGEDIVWYIETQRIKFWGYFNRLQDIKLVKHITDWKPIGIRTKERPKNRC